MFELLENVAQLPPIARVEVYITSLLFIVFFIALVIRTWRER